MSFLFNATPCPSFNSLSSLALFLKFVVIGIDLFLFFFENLFKFSVKRPHKILSSSDKIVLVSLFFFLLPSFCYDKFPIWIIRF